MQETMCGEMIKVKHTDKEFDMYLECEKAGELLQSKKLFIFDMDGTIYLGGKPFPFAIEFIKKLRKAGKRVLFFTTTHPILRSFILKS